MPFQASVIALPSENVQDFIDLARDLTAEHQPATITEEILVAKMAQHLWYSRRAMNMQSLLFMDSPEPDHKRLSLYIHYGATNDRAFSRCCNELAKMRKERREQEIGFVPQKAKQELHNAKVRSLNASAAKRELEVEVRKTVEAPLPHSLHVPFDTLKSLVSAAIADAAHKLEQPKREAA